MSSSEFTSWHVGVAAEAFAAGLFARCGLNVAVQYGANQPEYDLIVAKGEKLLKVSVKGSQDGSWGLTQSYLQDADYHRAADEWLSRHQRRTVLCLVQFKGVEISKLPRVYLVTPEDIATRLKETANGRGDTILYEEHKWGPRAHAAGVTERIPRHWQFSVERLNELLAGV